MTVNWVPMVSTVERGSTAYTLPTAGWYSEGIPLHSVINVAPELALAMKCENLV